MVRVQTGFGTKGFRTDAHEARLFVVRWQKAFELMLMMLACLWSVGKGFRADAYDAGLLVVRGQKAFELMLMMLACLWSVGKRLSS